VKEAEASLHLSPIKMWRLLAESEGDPVVIPPAGIQLIVFNSLGHVKEELISFMIGSDSVRVTDDKGKAIPNQINPVWTPHDTIASDRYQVMFLAKLNPLSLTTFFIKEVKPGEGSSLSYIRIFNHPAKSSNHDTRFKVRPPVQHSLILENDALKATFSAETGFLKSITTKPVVKNTKAEIDFRMYRSRGSGAYLFGPAGPAIDAEMSVQPLIRFIHGPIVSEIHSLQPLVNHTVRLYNTSGLLGSGLEVTNIVDLTSMDEKELIMHINTDIENIDGAFYTDENGFQTIQRRRFKNLPTAANYYPFSTHSYIEDSSGRFTIVAAQPLGVSSQDTGSLEVMLDRRLLYDDRRGMGEGVVDNKRTPSRFFLTIERPSSQALKKPPSAVRLSYPSLTVQLLAEDFRYYAQLFMQYVKQSDKAELHPSFAGLTHSLPCSVQLVNLRAAFNSSSSDCTLLLHKFAYTCDYSARGLPCSADEDALSLGSLFKDLSLKKASKSSLSLMYDQQQLSKEDKFSVALSPMDLHVYQLLFA
jgi:hypothetical protein